MNNWEKRIVRLLVFALFMLSFKSEGKMTGFAAHVIDAIIAFGGYGVARWWSKDETSDPE